MMRASSRSPTLSARWAALWRVPPPRAGSDASGNYSSKYAYLTIRVPSDKLTGFMGSLNDCGTITSQNLSSENISLEYADTEARREALQTEYDRLLELMAQAEDVDAVIAIEARLSEVRLQLDSLSSQLRTYDNLVDYSTVNIDLYEVRNISGAAATTLHRSASATASPTPCSTSRCSSRTCWSL